VNQRFTSVQLLDGEVIPDSLVNKLKDDGFHDNIFDDRDVMFIQIVPDSSMGSIEALGFLNLRQDIEGRIDARLKIENLGGVVCWRHWSRSQHALLCR
jgi:hypothetical protein